MNINSERRNGGGLASPGIAEALPRYEAAWPGIHAITVTKAIPEQRQKTSASSQTLSFMDCTDALLTSSSKKPSSKVMLVS